MLLSPAEIEAIIEDTGGVSFVVAGHPGTWCRYRVVDDAVLAEIGRGVQAGKYTAAVATGLLPELRQGTEVTVDGRLYVVRGGGRGGDGMYSTYFLAVPRE